MCLCIRYIFRSLILRYIREIFNFPFWNGRNTQHIQTSKLISNFIQPLCRLSRTIYCTHTRKQQQRQRVVDVDDRRKKRQTNVIILYIHYIIIVNEFFFLQRRRSIDQRSFSFSPTYTSLHFLHHIHKIHSKLKHCSAANKCVYLSSNRPKWSVNNKNCHTQSM